jgi:hypothetical protein
MEITEPFLPPALLNIKQRSERAVSVMILIRFAISIFALALLGMAFSLSAANSQQSPHGTPALTQQRG